MNEALQALTQINLDDLINAFGWQHQRLLARAVRAVFHRTGEDFARQMLAFDSDIASRGLEEAACRAERLYVRDVRLYGVDCLPDEPAIYLANHPGMTDTLALMVALAVPDLRIIALDRPFLLSLPNLNRHLFFLGDSPSQRVSLVRRVHRHLQAGGSILTFPAGHTEPDPDTQTGARASLESWTESAGVFLRFSPQIPIVPVCIRNVNWDVAIRSPLARLRRAALDQHLLSSALQLLANISLHVRPVDVKIQIGRPIRASDLGSTDRSVIHSAVLAAMRSLIATPPQGQGLSIL